MRRVYARRVMPITLANCSLQSVQQCRSHVGLNENKKPQSSEARPLARFVRQISDVAKIRTICESARAMRTTNDVRVHVRETLSFPASDRLPCDPFQCESPPRRTIGPSSNMTRAGLCVRSFSDRESLMPDAAITMRLRATPSSPR